MCNALYMYVRVSWCIVLFMSSMYLLLSKSGSCITKIKKLAFIQGAEWEAIEGFNKTSQETSII